MDKKGLILMLVIFIFTLSFIHFSSAAELTSIDSIKAYDSKTQTITLINKTDLTKNIAKIKLNTPLIYKVPVGYQKVAEMKISSYKDYNNTLEKVEFYDKNNKMEVVKKDFDYKVKTINEICKIENETNICHYEENWVPIEKVDFLKDDIKTIGIFTFVNYGDNIEWVPTWYNTLITEWASYVESSVTETTYLDGELNYTVFTFTSNGTFNYSGSRNLNASVLVVGAGGAGGSSTSGSGNGGGGAGGVIYNNSFNLIPNHNYTIIIGTGGTGTYQNDGTNGTNSSFSDGTISMVGWGGGGGRKNVVGFDGGSSAGSSGGQTTVGKPLQDSINGIGYGYWGGGSGACPNTCGGGGGGAGQNGTTADLGNNNKVGNGGNGTTFTIYNGTPLWYGGGGGGGWYDNIQASIGGNGGGGAGGKQGANGVAGTANTGGGGGGSSSGTGGAGGSGIVIVRVLTNDLKALKIPEITLNSPIAYYNTTNLTLSFNTTIYDNFKVQNASLYIDGVYNRTNTMTCTYPDVCEYYFNNITFSEGTHNWSILAYDNDSNPTQSGDRYFTIDTTPFINFTTPPTYVNYINTSNEYVPMKVNISTPYFKNITYYLENVNGTNFTQYYTNQTFDINFTNIPDAHYHYNVTVCTTTNRCNTTETRHINYDTLSPTINIVTPLNTTYYTTYTTTSNVTHTYNWTTSDLNLDSCWWSLDDGVTNNTVTCNNNYSFFYPFGQQTFIAWANDSSGNLGVSRVSATWDFMLYELSRFYNSSSVVSASENFILFLNKSSNILTQNATFKYNGISYPVATTTSGNLINFTASINIPANANSNNSFNWTIGFTNSTGLFFYNTTSSYQTIANITIANCSTTAGSNFALNFSTYDATNMTSLNTTFEMNFYFYDYSGDGSVVGEFLYTDTSENHSNFLFCMNSSNRNITANAVVSYGAENFDERQYYITNGTISNTVQNISLYLTETDLTDIVNIKLQDQGYVGISGAFISIQEWNVGTNTYSTIGMCQTSSTGDCIMDLELYTTFYRAVVYYDGSIIEITDTQKLSSTSWVITITLEEDNPYDLFENIATSLTFNNLTNITTYTWVDTSGYSQRGCLVVKNYTTTGQEIIYNSCTESVSGSIDYLISGDGSYYAYGYIYLSEYGTYKIVEYLEIQLGTLEINRITSPYGKVISFFIIGTLGMIGVAAGSALLGSVLVIIGLILSWKIGFLNITVSFIWSMVVIALLIIVLQNRRQQ